MKYFQNIKYSDYNTNKDTRQFEQMKGIVSLLAQSNDGLSIPEVAEHIKISVPTVAKMINELVENELILVDAKKDVENGRRPNIYSLDKQNFYVVGVEILEHWIHVSVDTLKLETVYEAFDRQFILEDTQECLNFIISFIHQTITASSAKLEKIIGIGIALTGSVNGHTGESADYFNNQELPLREYLEKKLEVPVTIDNDTRIMGIAEQVLGMAKGIDNALIVKVSRNLGLSIIIDKKIVFGGEGFAGNFGHIQLSTKNRLCTCGKKGCIRTEIGGDALLLDLKEELYTGETSIYFQKENIGQYKYHDIFNSVSKGDALSIKLFNSQGEKLGKALGNIINLLNPNLIVIGGEYVEVEDFFLDAVKAGLRKTGMINSLKNCKVEISSLGRYFSSRGAACMVLKNNELINY